MNKIKQHQYGYILDCIYVADYSNYNLYSYIELWSQITIRYNN